MATNNESQSDVSIALEGIDLDAFEQQVVFWKDHLDIAIEDLCAPIKLTKDQHIVARYCGNGIFVIVVESRGSGKTWLIALVAHVLAVLNPFTPVGIVSATEEQSTLVLKKLRSLADQNQNIRNEMIANGSRNPVSVNDQKGLARYKNGSSIESYSITSIRGNRCKIMILDEAPLVNQKDYEESASPVRNYKRDICMTYGFDDFPSKEICLTSACERSNAFYKKFETTVKNMLEGDPQYFACALNWEAPVASGLTDKEFFDKERERMPALSFAMEYDTIFVGAAADSAFPFQLVQACRVSETVELEQPKNSKARYVITLDLATSEDSKADNTIMCVIKFTEHNDGTFSKKLVYIRSFHGKSLDVIAKEVRILFHGKFPNTEKIIYDARGLGDSFDRFMDKEYVDDKGVEYPPLVVDDKPNMNPCAIPILHPFRAVQALNQRLYTNMRVSIEKHTLELPVSSRAIEEMDLASEKEKRHTAYEKYVFQETDALQIEMSNIVARPGVGGNVLYDVAKRGQHKDRYSSLAMGVDYICELEKENIKHKSRGERCIGIVSKF